MRLFLLGLAAALFLGVPAVASPPLDLFEESGVRLDAPDAQFVGSGDGPDLGLAGVGDLNGDGLGDLAFGSPGEKMTPGGAVHVLLGTPTLREKGTYSLSEDDSFTVTGVSSDPGHDIGSEVSGAGDVNGDGFGDLMVADIDRPDIGDGRATAYVIFGRPVPVDVDLDDLGPRGFAIRNVGHSPRLAGVGDLDKDGFDEVAVGSGIESDTLHRFSDVAVIYGSALPQDADATDLRDRGFLIRAGSDFAMVGKIGGAGDVNGDSWRDLVVGLPNSTAMSFPSPEDVKGAAVVFGGPRRTEPVDVSALGDRGFKIEIGTLARWPGESVAGLGDFNGDGLDDVAVATKGRSQYSNDDPEAPPAAAYVVFGSESTDTVSLTNLGSRGTRLRTGTIEGLYGAWVAAPGDVNNDGRPDLLVGVPGRDTRHDDDTGRAYVVFGGPSTEELLLRDLRGPYDEKRGFMLRGLPWDETGHRIAAPGDMDGDGWVELAVLAMECKAHRTDAGLWPVTEPEIYLPDFRSRSRGLGYATHGPDTLHADEDHPRIRGRGGSDHLIGDAADNCLYGSDSDDTVEGNAGADMLFGGPGDDEVSGGNESDSLFGGHGSDTLDGGPGDDAFQAGIHDDTLNGGTGNDYLIAKNGDDRLDGGEGDDYMAGGSSHDVLHGGPGSDHLSGGGGDDEIDTVDDEADTISCGLGEDTVSADSKDQVARKCEHVTRK